MIVLFFYFLKIYFNIFQANNLQSILEQTKSPAAETLKAASAYETLINEIEESRLAAEAASNASDDLSTMVTITFLHLIYR